MVTVHTVSCACCAASGQFSDGADIQSHAGRRLFNGLYALQFAAGQAVNRNHCVISKDVNDKVGCMKKCKRSIISGVLAVALCMGAVTNVHATTIEEAQERRISLMKRRKLRRQRRMR